MRKKKIISLIPLFLLIFYTLITMPIMKGRSIEIFITNVFFILTFIIVITNHVSKLENKNNIFLVVSYLALFVYSTFGQLFFITRSSTTIDDYIKINIIYIISIFLLMFGNIIMQRIKVKKSKLFDVECTYFTYIFLFIFSMFLVMIRVKSAGGIISFFTSSYTNKFASMDEAHIISGLLKIFVWFDYFNVLFLKDKNKFIRLCSRLYFIISLAIAYGSGSSLRVFYIIASVFFLELYNYTLLNKKIQKEKKVVNKRKKLIKRGIVFGSLGIVIAIIIRFNRESDVLDLSVLNNAYHLIVNTHTFDALYFCNLVIKNLPIQYNPGQLIYPLIFWLPRSIFAFKPVELPRIVALKFMNFGATQNGGFANTPIAEFYYDFGYFGIILGMLFIGMLMMYIQKKLVSVKNRYSIIISFCFIVASLSLFNSWVFMGSNYMGIFFFLNLVYFLNKIKWSR